MKYTQRLCNTPFAELQLSEPGSRCLPCCCAAVRRRVNYESGGRLHEFPTAPPSTTLEALIREEVRWWRWRAPGSA